MFVNIVRFPPVQAGKDAAFREWFAWSNAQYALQPGFVRRRLLVSTNGGTYRAIVEYESPAVFAAMEASAMQTEAQRRLELLLDGSATPQFYEVEIG